MPDIPDDTTLLNFLLLGFGSGLVAYNLCDFQQVIFNFPKP